MIKFATLIRNPCARSMKIFLRSLNAFAPKQCQSARWIDIPWPRTWLVICTRFLRILRSMCWRRQRRLLQRRTRMRKKDWGSRLQRHWTHPINLLGKQFGLCPRVCDLSMRRIAIFSWIYCLGRRDVMDFRKVFVSGRHELKLAILMKALRLE